MKKAHFILVIFLALLGFSCTQDEQVKTQALQEKEEIINVGFGLKGELSFSEGQIKTMETENQDIFAIQFYDASNKPYAFVVGDDISQITVDLLKDQPFKIKATFVKDGKTHLQFWDQYQEWGGPFKTRNSSGTILNKVYYSSANELYPARAYTQTKEDMSVSYLGNYSEVDRFYGVISNFIPTEENTVLNLELKRMVFGLKLNFILEDEGLDNLRFSINGQFFREYTIPVSEGIGALEIPYLTLGMPDCSGCAVALDFALDENYQENISISIGTTDHHTRFFDGEIKIRRNKMMVINDTLVEKDTNTGNF